jgi:hypothetical protein
MQCPDCGAYYSEEDEFCGECGRRLSPEAGDDTQETETWSPQPDSLEDLAGDLFEAPPEPPQSEPIVVGTKSGKLNLMPIALVVALALVMVCLCAGGAVVWFVLREDSTPAPPTAAMTEPGALLYEQSFDDPGSGWSTFDGDGVSVSYEDGGYQMVIDRTAYMVWGNPEPDLDLADMVIEVDVRQVEGPLDNNFGVFVRYLEGDDRYSYYWFQISADGFYSVDLRNEGEWNTLVGWEASPAVYTGLGVTNHIRVECSGGQFRFYNNNVHLVDVSDGTIHRGNIGLAAGTFEEPGVVVQFDDVRVYELGE